MKKRWIWIPLVLGILGVAAFFVFKRKPQEAVNYKETTVVRGDLTIKILSTGTVQPENRLEIKPPIAGRVEKVLVEEGVSVQKGQTLAVMSSTERAALLDAARAKGAAELKRWEEFYQATPILAPLRGEIILRNVEPGQTVTSGDALFAMSDRLTVKAQVDETDLAQVRLKQKAEIVLDAYPEAVLPGHVDQIAYEAKTVSSVTVYIVDVLPDKPSPLMRSGMTANVSFFTAERKGVLWVPSQGLAMKDGRTTVLLPPKSAREKPAEKEIQAGLSDGKKTEVTAGLAEGERIWIPKVEIDSSEKKSGSNPLSPFPPRRR